MPIASHRSNLSLIVCAASAASVHEWAAQLTPFTVNQSTRFGSSVITMRNYWTQLNVGIKLYNRFKEWQCTFSVERHVTAKKC
jgi:hypothetical protein